VPNSGSVTKAAVLKVDEGLGLVFGWAVVCTEKGEDYFDLNVDRDGPHKGKRIPENIPEDEMLKMALDFSENTDCPGNEMHDGPNIGKHVFLFPLTADIAKALNIVTEKTGLLIAYKPSPEVLAKFKSGEYTGFSIEGNHVNSELLDA
jgi:hypothetical protein